MIRTSIKVILLLSIFFWGSYQCKNFIDKSPYAECAHEHIAGDFDKHITQLILLNKSIAISQFFEFQMINYLGRVEVPSLGGDDLINLKMAKIKKKYMLMNIHEYFNVDKYYTLMRLSLEFDPDNFYTRQFGTYSALNRTMVIQAIDVLGTVYPKKPSWRYASNIGWLNFYWLRDYDKARQWFNKAIEFPDSPPLMVNIYNATFVQEKKYDMAITKTQLQLENTEDPQLRQTLENKLYWFAAMKFLINKSIEYEKKYRKPMSTLDDLIKADLIGSIPEDTLGEGFVWDCELREPMSKGNPFELDNPKSVDQIYIDDPQADF